MWIATIVIIVILTHELVTITAGEGDGLTLPMCRDIAKLTAIVINEDTNDIVVGAVCVFQDGDGTSGEVVVVEIGE